MAIRLRREAETVRHDRAVYDDYRALADAYDRLADRAEFDERRRAAERR